MAKRRKLEAPSAEDLTRLEAEFRGETSDRPNLAPIAQVAAEAALEAPVLPSETRLESAEIEAYRDKDARGLVLREIPIGEINPTEIFRDRTMLNQSELDELQTSIALNGLRMPIEVFALPDDPDNPRTHRFGLISGYRRLLAYSNLHDLTRKDTYARIKAIVRETQSTQQSLAAMIEENEIRADVSHYERGRVAAVAAQSGFFPTLEAAVNDLYPVASKAKRSKIRSFALIFEELGDLLEFPELLTEKQGLKIASALRDGFETPLRDALGQAVPEVPGDEWAVLEAVLRDLDGHAAPSRAKRGGRPSKRGQGGNQRTTSSGFEVKWGKEQDDYVIRVSGQQMDREILELLVDNLTHLLDKAN